jgi:hypothetical protein
MKHNFPKHDLVGYHLIVVVCIDYLLKEKETNSSPPKERVR